MSTLVAYRAGWTDEQLAAARVSWRSDLGHLTDAEVATECEYCARQLAYAKHAPDELGDSTIPAECWRELYAERIAWLDAESSKRQRIAGLYRKADMDFTALYVEEVKRCLDLADFITERHPDTRLKRYGGGSGYLGFCPWHDDQHRSLGVWERPEHHWYCFTCLEGGDVFNWLLKQDAQGFREAVKIAAEHAGIAPPKRRGHGAI